jgi:hypothetical protein
MAGGGGGGGVKKNFMYEARKSVTSGLLLGEVNSAECSTVLIGRDI